MTDPKVEKNDFEPLLATLELAGAEVLDLGCGVGSLARRIAKESGALSVTAIDVDSTQIERAIKKGGDVNYLTATAKALPLAAASLDAIVMMKSLHHVPISEMDAAFGEMARVLRSGGQVYICEPAYKGAFNDILRLFHDEGTVRAAAIDAIKRAEAGPFEIVQTSEYLLKPTFQNLDDFRGKVMNVPWLENKITPEIEKQVAAAWQDRADPDGCATLSSPMLVFVLRKL